MRLKPFYARVVFLTVFMLFFSGFALEARAGQMEMKVYLKEPTSGLPIPETLGKYEPAYGAIIGATDSMPGRSDSAILVYVEWGEYPYHIENLQPGTRVIQIAWQPSSGLAAVQDDDYVRRMAQNLRNYGGPVLLRFGGEMNGEWVAWGKQPELYVEKFRLISGIMHQLAPNVAMVWSPNFVPDQDIDQYYPGDQWVDWVGINGYADYYFVGNPDNDNVWWVQKNFHQGRHANPLLKFKQIYDTYSSRKPIMISETGVAWANRIPYQDVSDWGANTLKRLYGYLPLLYPRLKGIYYFNSEITRDFSLYNVHQNDTMQQAYQEATANPYYIGHGVSSFRYRPLDFLPSEVCDLATYINDEEGSVAAVEYYLDGRFVARTSSIPWETTCRFPSKGGQSTLEVRALDAQGNIISRTSQEIYVRSWQPISVELNGKPVSLDVAPAIFNGRVLAPIRAISEMLGAQVSWDDNTRTVQLNNNGKTMSIQVDKQLFLVNGNPVQAPDVSAEIVDSRVMVSLRYISESFGLKVSWNDGVVLLTQ